MKKAIILACVAMGMSFVANVPVARAVTNQMVSYKSGSETVSGYLVLPDGSGKHPGLIAIHEFWGLNDQVKGEAQKFAAQGYVVLAVDLYRGKVAATADEAHELMRGLPDDRGLRDLEAAFAYLASRSDVTSDKIGTVGWCMGGGWAVKLAISEPKLAATAVNYGQLPTDPANIAKIKSPLLGNFGADDRGISPDSVRAFQTAMTVAGKSADIKIYDGAGHGFQNEDNKQAYRPEATADAWARMTAFFKKMLQ